MSTDSHIEASAAPAKYRGLKGYFLSAFDGVYTVIKGMQITAKYCNFLVSFRPAGIERQRLITLQYPDEMPDIQPGFRGKHVYVKDKCIACRLCARACPIECIEMDIEGKGKNAIVHSYKVDYTKCLFCNLCSEACPTDCVWLGEEFDLTQYSRSACTMELLDETNADLTMPEKAKVAKAPKPPKPAPKPKPEAKAEAEAEEGKADKPKEAAPKAETKESGEADPPAEAGKPKDEGAEPGDGGAEPKNEAE